MKNFSLRTCHVDAKISYSTFKKPKKTIVYMKRFLIVAFLLLCGSASIYAQGLVVSGKVVDDSSGNGIQGVSVVVNETKQGVSTDADGNFRIVVSGSRSTVTLNVSYVGYQSRTVSAVGSTPVSVRLLVERGNLDDVVVIGYQTVRRRDVLASVASVGAKELKDIPINNAAEALNGRLAGVTATIAEGSPDADVRIRVRGGMSITGSNDPLYIIDGVQVESGLSTISPQDIQTIDVLKDASATAIYGARGANGVIIITTKSGKPGRTVVSYNGLVGVRRLARKLELLSPYEYVLYQGERARATSDQDSINFAKNFGTTWDTLANYQNVDEIDWQGEVFGRTGMTQTHNVTVSGGTQKITYNFGYTYNDDKAIVLNSKYNRHLLNFKTDYKITPKLKAGLSTRYTLQNVYGAGVSSDGGSSFSRLRNTIRYRPFLADSLNVEDDDPLVDPNVGNGLNLVNPIRLANAEFRRRTTDAYNITVNANYNITKNLSFRSTFGYDRNKRTDRQFSDSIAPLSIQNGRLPIIRLDTNQTTILTNSNVLTYSIKKFRKHHNFDFLVGEETYDLRTDNQSTQIRDFPVRTSYDEAFKNQTLGTPVAGFPRIREARFTQLSFFGRASYSYKDKYLLSANVRQDGASKFAPGKRWGTFPSGSIAWRITKEKFMENVDFINEAKLRFGFGTIGNNRIADYLYLSTFSNNGSRYYGINNQTVIAYYPTSLPNELLQWESTVNRNFGLDLTLLKNRLDMSIDYYDNSSKDLLLDVQIDPTYGFTTQYQNVGKTSNKGVELQLNATILRNPSGFNWSANFNISRNKNSVVALGPGQQSFFAEPSWGVAGQPTDYIVRIGDPVGSMWGFVTDGFYTVNDFDYDPTSGSYKLKAGVVNNGGTSGTSGGIIGVVQPGSIRFKDLNGDGIIDLANDRQIIGDPNPDFYGGLNQQFSYKQWDFSLFMNFSVGHDVYNANKIEFTNGYANNANMLNIMKDRWKTVTPTGQTAQWTSNNVVYGLPPAQLSALNANAKIWQPLLSTGAFVPHSWAIEDGSFLRLNNLTVGYSLPVRKLTTIHMSKLRFYFTANNLAILTNYTGYDPEVSVRNSPLTPNLDYSAYPKSRSFIFGINASF